jgi:hypothetical protein
MFSSVSITSYMFHNIVLFRVSIQCEQCELDHNTDAVHAEQITSD